MNTPYAQYASPGGPPPSEPTPREKVARLQSLARRGLGYWKMAALLLVVGCGLALFVATRVKLIYRSECVVLFKPTIRTNERQEEESPSERAAKLAPKLKEVLTTRTRLEGIIKELNLYPKIVETKGMLEAVDEMRTHVGFRGRDSETFVISFENESSAIARTVTQRLADTMIAEFTKSSVSTARQQAEFIGAQEARSEQELEAANKALATFLTVHPEFAVEAKGGAAFGMQPANANGNANPMAFMPSLPKDPAAMGDPELAVLFRQKARLEAEMKNGSTTPVAATPAGATQADSTARLVAQRDEAAKVAAATQADLAEKRTKLTDEHPDVIAAKSAADIAARHLHQAEVQLAAAQAPAGPSTNPYDSPAAVSPQLQRRLSAIDAQIAARRAAVQKNAAPAAEAGGAKTAPVTNELVELETEWQRLLRVLHDVKGEHTDLKQHLERVKLQASAAEASGGDQMQILDPAYLPLKPSQGGRTKTALAGGVLALLVALGYAFARVFLNDSLIDEADVMALQLVPVLGVLPKIDPSPRAEPRPRTVTARKEARSVV